MGMVWYGTVTRSKPRFDFLAAEDAVESTGKTIKISENKRVDSLM